MSTAPWGLPPPRPSDLDDVDPAASQHCYAWDERQSAYLCKLCMTYATEDHLHSKLHLKRKQDPAGWYAWNHRTPVGGVQAPAGGSPHALSLQQPPYQQLPQQQPLGRPLHQQPQCQLLPYQQLPYQQRLDWPLHQQPQCQQPPP